MKGLDSNLTIEQELSHRVFKDRVGQLSQSQAQELLIQMHKQMMIKENLYKELFLSQEKDIADSLFGVSK